MLQTSIILRAILLQLMKSENLEEAIADVRSLCSEEDINAVMEAYTEWREYSENS